MLPIITAAESARDEGDTAAFDEMALRLAGAVCGTLAGSKAGRTWTQRVTNGG